MDNSQASSSILDTLRTVEFRLGLKGYNVDEVDEYLDKAAQESEGLQDHVRQLNERLRQASERIAQLEREKRAAPVAADSEEGVGAAAAAAAATAEANALSDETLQRTLLLAQKFVDQTKRESEAEAAARAAIAAAEATSAQLQAETHQKLREEVTRLEATRTELATDVESMDRHLESERNRLRGALSEILKWVDENVQPANSLMGVKPKAASPSMPHDPDAPSQQRLPDPDGGPPTLNLQSASVSGGPGSI